MASQKISYLNIPFGEINNLGNTELVNFGNVVCDKMTEHSALFTGATPAIPALREGVENYDGALRASAGGDRYLAGQAKVFRFALLNLLAQETYFVLMVANGNPLVVEASGFPSKKTTRIPSVITVPNDLEVQLGAQSGEVFLSANAQKAAKSFIHQYSTDPLLKEENWVSMSCTPSKCKLTGLVPGTLYYFRVAAVGSNDQLLYSDVISKIVA